MEIKQDYMVPRSRLDAVDREMAELRAAHEKERSIARDTFHRLEGQLAKAIAVVDAARAFETVPVEYPKAVDCIRAALRVYDEDTR